MRAIIKSADTVNPPRLDPEKDAGLMEKVYGRVHLWEEAAPPARSRLWVFQGDFQLSDSPSLMEIAPVDAELIDTRMQEIFVSLGVSESDYGIASDSEGNVTSCHAFYMAINVPKSLIDGYSG